MARGPVLHLPLLAGGHTPILDRLLLMGAPIMRDSWGGHPLHHAENGQMEVRRLGAGAGQRSLRELAVWTTSCEMSHRTLNTTL